METAINSPHGTQWLALVTRGGELQIRSLPDLQIVLQSEGLASSAPSFTDDLGENPGYVLGEKREEGEEEDEIIQMVFCPIGKGTVRQHLLVSCALRNSKLFWKTDIDGCFRLFTTRVD